MTEYLYKNHDFGTFSLLDDTLAWVDIAGNDGALTLRDISSVWLGEISTGNTSGVGNASLTGVMDGTVLRTIPGSPPSAIGGGEGLWAMKIRAGDQLVSIYCNPAVNDDTTAFSRFVRAVHKSTAETNPSVSYTGGGVFNLLVFVFLSVMLFVLGGGAAFFGKATGLSALTAIGALLGLAGLTLLIWGIKTAKPKPYPAQSIPSKLLPNIVRK